MGIKAKPLNFALENGMWVESVMGFTILEESGEFQASWGEDDAETLYSLSSAIEWCQQRADDYIAAVGMVVEDADPIRDRFAAKAMHAEILTSASDLTPESCSALIKAAARNGRSIEAQIAFNAYAMADAMLLARKGSA